MYIKTRKTASTSIEIALSKFCGPDDVITEIVATDEQVRSGLGYPGPQNFVVTDAAGQSSTLVNHMPAQVAQQVLGAAWGEYFSFTIERNPFDRVISQYYWELPLWERRGVPAPSLTDYLTSRPIESLTNWPLYADGDRVLVNQVGRYEDLDADLRAIAERIGLPEPIEVQGIKTKHGWRKDRRNHREVLSDQDRQFIEGVCGRELAAFGYHW